MSDVQFTLEEAVKEKLKAQASSNLFDSYGNWPLYSGIDAKAVAEFRAEMDGQAILFRVEKALFRLWQEEDDQEGNQWAESLWICFVFVKTNRLWPELFKEETLMKLKL